MTATSSEPIVGAVVALMISHQKAVNGAIREAWRWPDGLFLVNLLSAVCCSDGGRRHGNYKYLCFEALRQNELDAAGYLQRWWRSRLSRATRHNMSITAVTDEEVTTEAIVKDASSQNSCGGSFQISHSTAAAAGRAAVQEPADTNVSTVQTLEPHALPHLGENVGENVRESQAGPEARQTPTELRASFHGSNSMHGSLSRDDLDLPRCGTANEPASAHDQDVTGFTAGDAAVEPSASPTAVMAVPEEGEAVAAPPASAIPDSAATNAVVSPDSVVAGTVSATSREHVVVLESQSQVTDLLSAGLGITLLREDMLSAPQEETLPAYLREDRAAPDAAADFEQAAASVALVEAQAAAAAHRAAAHAEDMPVGPHPAQASLEPAADKTCMPQQAAAEDMARDFIARAGGGSSSGRPHSRGASSGASSNASTPRGADDGRCRGIRGENPYRRKWNPRLAAANRRQREQEQREEQQQQQHQREQEEKATAWRRGADGEDEDLSLQAPNFNEPPAIDMGDARAGFSMATPGHRGPEHQPGMREQLRGGDAGSLIAAARGGPGRSHMAESSDHEDVHGLYGGGQPSEGMDFAQIQQMISRGIASAEAGEEPSLEVDQYAAAAGVPAYGMPPPPAAPRRPPAPPGERRSLPGRSYSPRVVEADAGFDEVPAGRPQRRSMAEIRSAAERRREKPSAWDHDDAVGAAEATSLVPLPPVPMSSQHGIFEASPIPMPARTSGMSAIRAIAEKRSTANRGLGPASARGSTPPPHQQHQQSRGVAYRPTKVYAGRNAEGGGGGLTESLGLRYGVPPPGR